MDFAYPPDLAELQDRARGLADLIAGYEDRCEENNGLPPDDLAAIAHAVREAHLGAINMPSEWGGQGLSILQQVVVQEQLGRLTNALWDTVWRPANALRACDDEATRALPGAVHSGPAAGLLRGHGGGCRQRSAGHPDRRPAQRRRHRLDPRRREVVRHGGRRRRPDDRARDGRRRSDALPCGQGNPGGTGQARSPVHAHVRLRAPGVRLRGRRGRRRSGARRRSGRGTS